MTALIKLTNKKGAQTVRISAYSVGVIVGEGNGSMIYVDGCGAFHVDQDPEIVEEKLAEVVEEMRVEIMRPDEDDEDEEGDLWEPLIEPQDPPPPPVRQNRLPPLPDPPHKRNRKNGKADESD